MFEKAKQLIRKAHVAVVTSSLVFVSDVMARERATVNQGGDTPDGFADGSAWLDKIANWVGGHLWDILIIFGGFAAYVAFGADGRAGGVAPGLRWLVGGLVFSGAVAYIIT